MSLCIIKYYVIWARSQCSGIGFLMCLKCQNYNESPPVDHLYISLYLLEAHFCIIVTKYYLIIIYFLLQFYILHVWLQIEFVAFHI